MPVEKHGTVSNMLWSPIQIIGLFFMKGEQKMVTTIKDLGLHPVQLSETDIIEIKAKKSSNYVPRNI